MDAVNRKIHFFVKIIKLFLDENHEKMYNHREVMKMGMVEKVRIACVKRGNISEAELARRVGVSPQNFNNKMKRDNFTETDLREIAAALGLELDISFIDPETGEKI